MTWTKEICQIFPKYLCSSVPASIKYLGARDSLGFWWQISRFLNLNILICSHCSHCFNDEKFNFYCIFLNSPNKFNLLEFRGYLGYLSMSSGKNQSSNDFLRFSLEPTAVSPIPQQRAQHHRQKNPQNPKKTNPEIKIQLVFNSSFALWKRNQPSLRPLSCSLRFFLPLNIFWLQSRLLQLAEVCHNLTLFLFSDLFVL